MRHVSFLILVAITSGLILGPRFVAPARAEGPSSGNRLTYLDQSGPYYVHRDFPRLTTPQWVGEPNVDAVVILAIDDMRKNTPKYEGFLRPILNRLKAIDGRAPVSIMTCTIDPKSPTVRDWLAEGVSIEAHTLDHPCPLLQKGDFEAAARTYHGCVDLLNAIPNMRPVAFRMPCCDSINSPSPRFFDEIFNARSEAQNFLELDSSVFVLLTPDDPDLPRSLVVDEDGTPKFKKYLPFPSFVNTIENYPYPYLIGRKCWEFPCIVPSDWEAQNLHGVNNPKTIEDWKRALDAIVIKKGVFTMVFHPHGWIEAEQVVDFIDYAQRTYGDRVKFLNFREARDRLTGFMLGGQPVRDEFGRDNGVRLIDLDSDGYLDVLLGDGGPRLTKLWRAGGRRWELVPMPTSVIQHEGAERPSAVRFGILDPGGSPAMLGGDGPVKHCWIFDRGRWVRRDDRLNGLPPDIDGLRLRDLDGDGRCEAIIANQDRAVFDTNGVYVWSDEAKSWEKRPFRLPTGAWTSGIQRLDAGLRFLDLDENGIENDLVYSNDDDYGAFLFTSMNDGWGRVLRSGKAGEPGAIRPIVRNFGQNNGFFAKDRMLWWQNEDTADLPDLVDRLPYDELLETPESDREANETEAGTNAEPETPRP